MISAALVAGIAGVWLWAALNDDVGILGRVNKVLGKSKVTAKWMRCPWCSGAWFAIAASVVAYHPHDGRLVVTAVAAAGVTGLIGSYLVQENH